MEKKGEIINQLAIISDLLEKVNLESESISVNYVLNEHEFKRTFELIRKFTKKKQTLPMGDMFLLQMGEVEFVFNMSNV